MMINALYIIPVKTASCSVMGDYAIKQKRNVTWGKKKVGDIVLYDFNRNGTSDHTGIIEAINKDGTITVIEGNTSEKSNDNGGNVMRRTRYKSQVNYFVRPKYDKKVTPQMVLAVARSQLGTKESPKNSNNVIYNTWYYGNPVHGDAYPWCMTFVEWCFAHVFLKMAKPNPTYTGIIPKPTIQYGSKGTGAKQLQQFLTWYGIKTNADGEIGNASVSSIMQFQFNEGLTVDGIFGKKSYARAVTYLKPKAAKPVAKPIAKPVATPQKTPQKPSVSVSKALGKCIDVSYWQGKIPVSNWQKILKSCKYVICRASYTSLSKFSLATDSTFDVNVKNAIKAGCKYIGAYHFSQALSVAEAQKEAKYLCDILDKYKGINFWIACDYETNSKGRLNGKTVSTKASEIANAFCAVVEKRGYKACIYANYTMLTKYLKAPKYPIWLAQYNKTKSYNKNVVMWQYTSSGKVDGIDAKVTNNKSSNVDLSYVYAVPVVKKPTASKPVSKPVAKPVTVKKEPKGYTGTFPTLNSNRKIINGLAYRMCYPYGTPEKKYTYKDGKPTVEYKNGIDKVFPKHMEWPNKRQKVGACCDVFVAVCLGILGIKVSKDLKNQLVEMPKMTNALKPNGHYLAKDFELGDVVQRGRKDRSGHTWIVCELINGVKFIANAHYKHLGGTYAVMDAKPKNIVKSKWAYYKCYTVLGAIRTYYKQGDYGYDVLYIQKFLNWYGIKCKMDGDYGTETAEAVSKFQKSVGLKPCGQVGEKTIAKMKSVKK